MQSSVKYNLSQQGAFVIENYNHSKPFSNFFPGIAGLWGVPMWVFYVNRGQCVSSFGIESKDKAIVEFQPANKAYRLTALQGFRTLIKVKDRSRSFYWEPFQEALPGTDYKKTQRMIISAHDLTIEETNLDLGLKVQVNYFTLPEEPYAALIRSLTVKNLSKSPKKIELIDGLPMIVPYGLRDAIHKNMSRTVEAWTKVRNLEGKAPYYHLNVEVSDVPQVTHIKEGNFFFSFDPQQKKDFLLDPIIESSVVFGESRDFTVPENFINSTFKMPKQQYALSKTPSAMCYHQFDLKGSASKEICSVFGYADSQDQLKDIVSQTRRKGFIEQKIKLNHSIIQDIKEHAFTHSASTAFNLYSEHTFLDNVLRGGLPISLQTKEGKVVFNVFSRKHGDPERDYNYFVIAPTYFSQGNGNYRDVNQNRRNDIWFNKDVRDSHMVSFLNLIQADGYNPLVVKGTMFTPSDKQAIQGLLKDIIHDKKHYAKILKFIERGFLPGQLLKGLIDDNVSLAIDIKDFLGRLLECCRKHESADHGEGFWSDHWTYNLDLVESYLAFYPEDLKTLLFDTKEFHFHQSDHYVLPRASRYILTSRGVRQYKSVAVDHAMRQEGHQLKTKQGVGGVYKTHLLCKLLCLVANKVATLDPGGVGVEMEADKPNWYDALNGLPGLIGSSISETFEIKRLSVFLLESLKRIKATENVKSVQIFEELATFVEGLASILSTEKNPLAYWNKSNDVKEHYRQRIRKGIEGAEKNVSIKDIENFLQLVIERTDLAVEKARMKGHLATYFYHEVDQYNMVDKHATGDHALVKPTSFKMHALPLFLEGYVHALRVEDTEERARELYAEVRTSPLFDRSLKMYKVNMDLSTESEEIGRTRIFPSGWLENESIWLHMEYKLLLELLRRGLYEEFYENFKSTIVAFLKPEQYGRSILENSSFLASSAHEDSSLHGQGFVARLSGSTAEFMHMWLIINAGKAPFSINTKGQLQCSFQPSLPEWMFTKKASKVFLNNKSVTLPKNSYAFKFLNTSLVVYHNPKRKNTFGAGAAVIKEYRLTYFDKRKPVVISAPVIPTKYATDIRNCLVSRMDVILG